MQALLAGVVLLLLWPATAPAGLQVQPIDLDTREQAAQPSLAVDPAGGFILTWQERASTEHALHFALLDAQGREGRRGQIAGGSDWFLNGADFPSLVVLDNGDWVSFWLQKTAPDTYAYTIRSVRSRDRGRHWDAPITLHRDGSDTEHGFVSMAPAGADRVQFVWLDGRHMAAAAGHDHGEGSSEHMTLRTATLGRAGRLREERELDALTCACCQTDAARGSGRTVFVYRDRSAAEIRDIGALVWTRGRWSGPGRVHADDWTIAGCPVNGPAIAARGGRFAVLWPTMAGGQMQLRFAQGDGEHFDPPVDLAVGPSELGRVDLATWGRAGFLASRVRQDADGAMVLFVDVLDGQGRSAASQQIAQRVGGFPRLARQGTVALLAWTEGGTLPGRSRVRLARLTPADGP